MAHVISPAQIAEYAAVHWKPGELLLAVSIALGESDGATDALYINPKTGDHSYGLWQVNMEGSLLAERLKQYNLSKPEDLYDPATNARVAHGIYLEQGWGAWGAYTDGGYKRYGRYEAAQAGVKAFEAKQPEKPMPYTIQRPVNWRGPVPNESTGEVFPLQGVVLHIMEGSLDGTDSWFHDQAAQASADYGVGKDGRIDKWVDWEHGAKAWAEIAGNPHWVSIELEGHSGDSLTPDQLDAVSQIVAYVFSSQGVPFQEANAPAEQGLGYHAMGGDAWGGHYDCPGKPIIAQRAEILTKAHEYAGDEMTDADFQKVKDIALRAAEAIWYGPNSVYSAKDFASAPLKDELDAMKEKIEAIAAKVGA